MPIILLTTTTTPLFRIQLDQRIDSHNRYARLDRTLQLPHLAHARLQHARLDAIHHLTPREIQTIVLVVLLSSDVFLRGRESVAVG